jgi:hypothetical protein
MKNWSERSAEERHRILFAPFPVVRYIARGGGYAGSARPDPDLPDDPNWRDVYEEDTDTGLTIRKMWREWWRG